ncbi:ATP-binding protein [Rhodococcus sp. W8901]|uniref:ATP-binding protein n=1 Tax=Rhodococcus sp. W8901 TaxID=2742603 RepID=UPI001584476D|nr:ATP-binding protein [Rhodococcus sp. W8901]QKT13746.1 ATP-binding protein [Rhodococcus sp. W8901]
MSSAPPKDPIPSDGERNALVGFSAQFALAAKIVYRYIPALRWIRVADPSAGVADDFQFVEAGHRHALQVKWSQFPGPFTWSDLFGSVKGKPSLFAGLAEAWQRLRDEWDGPLTVHLCTNNFPSVTRPDAKSVLKTATDSQRHFAAFLSRSFVPVQEHLRLNPKDGWEQIAVLGLVTSWSDAWTMIKDSTGLAQNELTDFVRDFDLAFIPLDQSELLSPRDINDQNHLAATLQGVVVDPARIVELDRSALMARLDWSSRTRYQNPHRFPVPVTYAANSVARTALEESLARHKSGYLALVGPPGSGKSTLVEKVSVAGRLIRYYSFVPDAPDPLSGRGEAQSFLHDLSLALEEAGIYRRGFGADLAGQRAVLVDQLDRAGDKYAKDGTRTTIIVDGLDHIPREQNPTRSLLDELPSPATLPLGVCIVLSSQTTSILPTLVRDTLTGDIDGARVIDVPPLANDEVESIATMAGVADWMLPGQVSDLVEISEGHPLVLTYMIQDLRTLETEPNDETRRNLAGHMLTSAAEHRGSIDQRYSHYLGSLAKDDDAVFAILGTVCRLRIPVDLKWLETWVDASAVTRFADLTHTFFRREGNEWTFIHNSFRRFLVDQTAMVGGHIRDWRSRELHEQLADQCAASANWPQYQDEELVQRYLAGQFQKVLDAATPADLRANLFSGRPFGVVRDQAVVVLRAATGARDYRAMIRSLMFLNELQQRDYVIDADTMARAMSTVDPDRAVEHVVQGRSLRIKTPAALEIAAELAANNSLESAESIVRAAGGLQGLISDLGHSHVRPHELEASIADWAEVSWHRSGLERVLDELDHFLPFPGPIVEANSTGTSGSDDHSANDDGRDDLSVCAEDAVANSALIRADSEPADDADDDTPDNPASDPAGRFDEGAAKPSKDSAATAVDGAGGSIGRKVDDDRWKAEREAREARETRAAVISARNAVHARCVDLADSVRDIESLSRLAERINAESSPEWRARIHAVAARTALKDGDPVEVLRQVQLLLAVETPASAQSPNSSRDETPIPAAQQMNVDAPAVQTDSVGQVKQVEGAQTVIDVDHDKRSAGGAGADGASDIEVDEEEATSSSRRLPLTLRVFAANALAMSGQARTEEFRELLPAETKPSWPSLFGTSDGLKPYKTILLVLRMRELHQLIGIYDTIPEAGLDVPGPGHDPGRTRFIAAMTIVAKLEAQAAAFAMGLASAPDVPAVIEPVIRLLEVPHTTTRNWTGWYQISDAGIELIAALVPLAYRCGGGSQVERLLARFKAAWDNPDRATYWPARRRVVVIRAAAAYVEATEWCRTELDGAEALVVDEGDPYGRATTWLEFARARTDIADHDSAIAAVEHAHRNGWGPGQSDKDYQLVTWLSWLTEAADLAVIDRATFLTDACAYAARLLAATGEADWQASEAASDLIIAVFQRDAGLAISMAEALCDRGVITEPDTITALLTAAAQCPDVEPELVASLLTELLMPLSLETPHEIEKALLDRCTNAGALTEQFANARSLWSVSDSQIADEGVAAPAAGPSAVAEDGPALPLATVLGQMRSYRDPNVPADTARRWSQSIEQCNGSVSRAVAVAVLEQVERLHLGNLDAARAAGIASRAGAANEAREALSCILARTTPYGWQRNWDGGSRIQLFEAAIRDCTDDLVDLAARDLAGLVASKAIAAEFSPRDLKRFAELFGGPELVAECWADIRDYLDVFVPAHDELAGLRPTTSSRPELELITWTAQHLGHPIRIIDFGVRRVLAQNYAQHRTDIELALAEPVSAGGWFAEAALNVLVRVGAETSTAVTDPAVTSATPTGLSPALISALEDAAVSNDAINRHLASRALIFEGVQPPIAPTAQLPALYGIELPPLPKREIPELDRRGVPFVDTSNPQQIIAPYDDALRYVADDVDIDAHTLYHRAASLGQAMPDRWTDGGHNAHFERLSRRGTRHVYRPWAYMVGRRGCARVLAELIDAQVLPRGPYSLWLSILFDDILNWIAPHPLDPSTPLPWRAPDSKDYASEEWCDQTQPAAEHYAAQFADNHVLCENSQWRWLTWETPDEIRRVRTRHGKVSTSKLFTAKPVPITIETTVYRATDYPVLPDLRWSNEELVVGGRSYHSDPERLDEWLALHPAAADALGWIASDTPFEWIGSDGDWRARSVFRVRGQLSHQPPSDTTSADVWQVVLSDQGWFELAAKFTNLQRTVTVKRVLEANQKKQRGRLQKSAAVTIADTSS